MQINVGHPVDPMDFKELSKSLYSDYLEVLGVFDGCGDEGVLRFAIPALHIP